MQRGDALERKVASGWVKREEQMGWGWHKENFNRIRHRGNVLPYYNFIPCTCLINWMYGAPNADEKCTQTIFNAVRKTH